MVNLSPAYKFAVVPFIEAAFLETLMTVDS